MKVMIIDDDVITLNLLKDFLGEKEIATILVNDSNVALDWIRKEQPDLIFMDIKMGPPTGRDIIEMMNAEHIKIPVVVISGFLTQNIKRGLSTHFGVKKYLPKPFTLDEVGAIVDVYNKKKIN